MFSKPNVFQKFSQSKVVYILSFDLKSDLLLNSLICISNYHLHIKVIFCVSLIPLLLNPRYCLTDQPYQNSHTAMQQGQSWILEGIFGCQIVALLWFASSIVEGEFVTPMMDLLQCIRQGNVLGCRCHDIPLPYPIGFFGYIIGLLHFISHELTLIIPSCYISIDVAISIKELNCIEIYSIKCYSQHWPGDGTSPHILSGVLLKQCMGTSPSFHSRSITLAS